MGTRINYKTLESNSLSFWCLLGMLALLVINGLVFARYMEHEGHWVTGMNNQVVWGIPHVFAIFLIVAASGVLNVASIASVFNQSHCKAWARLSGLLAITLLAGGLMVLVLDLGRPDRLIVAMTHYNFKSIFAWNVFLYTGFVLIVGAYLWTMFEPRMNRYIRAAGMTALLWRIILTTGTGSIFGVLVAREAYDVAIMAPWFVAMSLSFGTAFFVLALAMLYRESELMQYMELLTRLRNLLGVFVTVVLYLTGVFHAVKLYSVETYDMEMFILLDSGVYTGLFWVGHIVAGSLLPLLLLFWPGGVSTRRLIIASGLVTAGGLALLYVIIIGGQAYPLDLFPGMEESSSFFDGEIARYRPTLAEFSLGIGGLAAAILATVLVMRVLPFLPGETARPRD